MKSARPTVGVALLSLPDEAGEQRLRGQLRVISVAWVFGALWMWTINGAVMTKFALAIGVPPWGFGILAALPFAGALFQLPAGWITERYGHRKTFFLVVQTLGRLMWALMAAVPWVLPHHPGAWWPLVVLFLLFGWASNAAAGPAWMSWMADIIPGRLRGRYFGKRARIGQVVGIATTIMAGLVLDIVDKAGGGQAGAAGDPMMLRVTSVVLAIAGLSGVLDIQCFVRVPDHHQPPPKPAIRWSDLLVAPLRDRNFRWFLGFTFCLNLGLGFLGQYVWLYVYKVAHFSDTKANLVLVALPLALQILSYPIWGLLVDRLGKKPVMVLSLALISSGSLGWMIVGPEHWMLGYATTLLSPLAWPGVELANLNVILDMSATRARRADDGQNARPSGRVSGAGYVAMNTIAVAVGGVLSGGLGAAVAYFFEDLDWRGSLAGIQVIFTFHSILFVISALLRLAALYCAAHLHEPRAAATRDAARLLTSTVWSNMIQAVYLPPRLLGRAAGWTYRLTPRASANSLGSRRRG